MSLLLFFSFFFAIFFLFGLFYLLFVVFFYWGHKPRPASNRQTCCKCKREASMKKPISLSVVFVMRHVLGSSATCSANMRYVVRFAVRHVSRQTCVRCNRNRRWQTVQNSGGLNRELCLLKFMRNCRFFGFNFQVKIFFLFQLF